MYKHRIIKMQLNCIWITILHNSFTIGCVSFNFFPWPVDESAGNLLASWRFAMGPLLGSCDQKAGFIGCLNDVLYYWEIKAQCCTAATVALCSISSPAPSNASFVSATKLLFSLALCIIECSAHLKISSLLDIGTNLFFNYYTWSWYIYAPLPKKNLFLLFKMFPWCAAIKSMPIPRSVGLSHVLLNSSALYLCLLFLLRVVNRCHVRLIRSFSLNAVLLGELSQGVVTCYFPP